jgi:Heavy metal associated domain 2
VSNWSSVCGPYAYIRHHIVGQRLRLKVEDATPRLLNEIRERLLNLPRVESVDTNPITGSLLILYSRNDAAEFCQALFERVTDLVKFAPESQTETGDYSATALDVLKVIKQADDGLRNDTGGRVDLKLLFPLGMVLLTIMTLPTNLQTPLWLSFLMFGFSSFESMHTGALDQPTGKLGEQHESDSAAGGSQG